MVRISPTSSASSCLAAAAGARLAVKASYAEAETPAAWQAAVTGKTAAFWASTQW
jgi:hypothetical protein